MNKHEIPFSYYETRSSLGYIGNYPYPLINCCLFHP